MRPPVSSLFFPPPALAGCIFVGIFRDTRGAVLSAADRFNHFPASPLYAATFVISGTLQLVETGSPVSMADKGAVLPSLSVVPPQDGPVSSWAPRDVAAVTIGIYPDALAKLNANDDDVALFDKLEAAFATLGVDDDPLIRWHQFCDAAAPVWQSMRGTGGLADWSGSTRIADWSRSIVGRAAVAGPGRSVRAFERRLRRWSKHSRQSLNFFAEFEELQRLAQDKTTTSLAAIAHDAGYADQSHMGRAVRRATGFSPAQLNRFIETNEAFWCYRLLGERF